MTQEEIVREFRDFLNACKQMCVIRYEYGIRAVKADDWDRFELELDKADRFLSEEVDGSKQAKCARCRLVLHGIRELVAHYKVDHPDIDLTK